MKKSLLLLLIVPLLITTACSSKDIKESEENKNADNIIENINENLDSIAEPKDTKKIAEDKVVDSIEYDYILYENKAVGYNILRPDDWYWQHFMKAEINKAGRDELVDDYLVIDKNKLVGLASKHLGQIVIEKSKFSLETLAMHNKEYTSKKVTIAGQDATRFELKTDNTLIEYHLTKNGSTYRLMYSSSDGYETVFEKIVTSFKFVE